MARELKQITGNITKLNEPTYAAKRGVWVMMVKENNSWVAINSRDEAKIKVYYKQLQAKQTATDVNVKLQATTLDGQWLKAAEFSVGVFQQNKVDDPTQMLTAVQSHIELQKEIQYVPKVFEAADLFYAKQVKRQLSPHTLSDYVRLVKLLKLMWGDRYVSTLTSTEIKNFIEESPVVGTQRARYIYIKTFINFCSGKMNPYSEGRSWVKQGLLQWEAPKHELNEVSVYSYDEIISLLKAAKEYNEVPYFIFRLFSMTRYFEMERFCEIHDKVTDHPLINLEAKRITFSQEVYKKRSRNEHRGRFYNNLHPTFLLWLNYFKENNLSISCNTKIARKIRRRVKGKEKDTNLLRHTAITYHCLAFKNPLQTAFIAGNSAEIISNHYLNMNISEGEALKFYELTPQVAKTLGIID